MAVAFDAKMVAGNGAGGVFQQIGTQTSFSSTGITVGAGATLLVAVIHVQRGVAGDPGTISATWNGGAMTAGPTTVNGQNRSAIFYLVSPAAGALSLAASWANSSDAYLSAASFTGVDTTTPIVAVDSVTGTTGTTVTITSDTNGATVAMWGTNGGDPVTNFTEIFSDAPLGPGAGASYQLGGTSNGHTFTGAGGTTPAWAGIHIQADAGAGGAGSIAPPLGPWLNFPKFLLRSR
jgi:hypothetical protein